MFNFDTREIPTDCGYCRSPRTSGKGIQLATLMIKHVLHTLAPKYPILRLFVTRGIPAESLYKQLGFTQGHPFTSEKAIDLLMLTKYGFKESDIPLDKLLHFNQE